MAMLLQLLLNLGRFILRLLQVSDSIDETSKSPRLISLDREPNEHGNSPESITTTSLRQPWRAYWPPRSSNVLNIWSHSEYPEVLSWRFDNSQPFDRPWRIWTKSVRAKNEEGTVTIDGQPIEREWVAKYGTESMTIEFTSIQGLTLISSSSHSSRAILGAEAA